MSEEAPGGYSIRFCSEDDRSAAAVLASSPEASQWMPPVDADRSSCWVVESGTDKRLVGLLITRTAADEAEILNLAIAVSHRRQGLASALVAHAFRAMSAQSIRQVFLEVRASNAPAIALYESLGFTRTGIRKNYYSAPSDDALLMARKLTG